MGDIFTNMWNSITQFLLSNLAEGIVYIAIAILFIVAIVKCVLPLSRVKRRLLSASRVLRKGDRPDAWKEKNFLGKGALYPHWNEYLSNRLFADDDYQSATSIDDYINDATVIDDVGSTAFSDTVPGIMVSLGFLGTLIGMMMGLSDFKIEDAATTMSALEVLINGIRYAFATSIVGVVASILFSLIARLIQSSTFKALNTFIDSMKQHAGAVTVDPMNQIAIYQQEQSAMLQDVTANMADRMGNVLEMALQPIHQSLNDFIVATSQEQVKGVDRIVNRFVDRMEDVLGGQFNQLSDTIAKTCQWQNETRESLQVVMDGIGRVSRDILQIEQMSESLIVKFDGYMTKLGSAQLQIDDGYAAVSANVKSMEVVARQEANYVAQIGQLHNDLKKDIAAYQASMEEFAKSFTDNSNISAGALKKVSEELRMNGDVLNDAHKTFIVGVNKELSQTFDMFDNNMSEVTNQLSWVVGNIKDAIEGLPAVIEGGAQGYARELERLTEVMQGSREYLERMTMYISEIVAGGQNEVR